MCTAKTASQQIVAYCHPSSLFVTRSGLHLFVMLVLLDLWILVSFGPSGTHPFPFWAANKTPPARCVKDRRILVGPCRWFFMRD